MIALDLDMVNHQKLLERLYTTFGLHDNVHEWIRFYLTGRRQFVMINGARSEEHEKTCDVPQMVNIRSKPL